MPNQQRFNTNFIGHYWIDFAKFTVFVCVSFYILITVF